MRGSHGWLAAEGDVVKKPKARLDAWAEAQKRFAQFIAVCSSAKPCEIGENLLSVSDPISRLQERLIHVGALVRPPALQRRTVSRLHSYAAMERSASPMSVVSEPQRWSLGRLPLPARTATLPL